MKAEPPSGAAAPEVPVVVRKNAAGGKAALASSASGSASITSFFKKSAVASPSKATPAEATPVEATPAKTNVAAPAPPSERKGAESTDASPVEDDQEIQVRATKRPRRSRILRAADSDSDSDLVPSSPRSGPLGGAGGEGGSAQKERVPSGSPVAKQHQVEVHIGDESVVEEEEVVEKEEEEEEEEEEDDDDDDDDEEDLEAVVGRKRLNPFQRAASAPAKREKTAQQTEPAAASAVATNAAVSTPAAPSSGPATSSAAPAGPVVSPAPRPPATAAEAPKSRGVRGEDESGSDNDDDLFDDDDDDDGLNLFGEADAAWSKRKADGTATDNSLNVGDPNYDPVSAASWPAGKPVPYLALARLFEDCSKDRGRLRLIGLVSDFFRTLIAVSPDQLLPAVYLCCNKLAPSFEGLETGVGEQVLMRAIAESTGGTLATLKARVHESGDLGEVAETLRATQRTLFQPAPLTMQGVFNQLRSMAAMTGQSAVQRRKDAINRMLVACRECETKYLVRALQGNLRVNLAESTVIHALCRAVTLTPPSPTGQLPPPVLDLRKTVSAEAARVAYARACAMVKHVYTEVPSHDRVIPALLKYGYEDLHRHVQLTPGVPIKSMLGRPTHGVDEVFERYPDMAVTFEWKYDGERAQIHMLPDGTVRIFSRNSEDHTPKYPDVIGRLKAAVRSDGAAASAPTVSFIIDCEVVAYDTRERRILPFQTLSTRKRKAVAEEEVTVQVCLYAFDLICLNGESFMRKPFRFRREKLWATFAAVEGQFQFAHHLDSTDPEQIREFMDEAMEGSCEGLMVKTLDRHAFYVPNKRNWLKIKKDYVEGLGDTLDLVPIGAWIGRGKRAGSYGAFLMACYDEQSETFQSLTKIGTGLKDADLLQHYAYLKDRAVETRPANFDVAESLVPDVYFEPSQVWEVKAADLSVSPVHRAAIGLVDPDKGIALRFPRFLRIRDDKKPEDATSSQQVADMYLSQSVVRSSAGGARAARSGGD